MDEHGLPIAFGKQAQISLPPKPQSAPPAASGEGERGPRGIVGGSRKNKGGGGGGVPQGSKQDFNTGDKVCRLTMEAPPFGALPSLTGRGDADA